MTMSSALTTAPAPPTTVGQNRRGSGAAFVHLVLRNRKALVGSTILLVFILVAVFAPVLAPYSPTDMTFHPLSLPSWRHPLGTTDIGQDIFSQLVWGTRVSLEVGFLAGGLTTFLSVLVGMVSGYVGGVVDEILQLITNIFLIIPALPLMVVVAAYIPFRGTFPIVLVITLTGWAWGARVLRSQTLSLRNQDFVLMAMARGETPVSVVFREILPNMVSLVISNLLFNILGAILAEAGLEFLGLGNVNTVSWGTMLYWANNDQALLSGAWYWLLPPGLCIALVGAALALMNYALDEITNPRLRTREVARP